MYGSASFGGFNLGAEVSTKACYLCIECAPSELDDGESIFSMNMTFMRIYAELVTSEPDVKRLAGSIAFEYDQSLGWN